MGLVCDKPSNHGEHFCQVFLKSYGVWLKCGSYKVQSYQIVLI